ncbi:unnamed protein product [Rotaria socialis]|uniref:Uncharacterized protein n=1 Tax=Rotaria socialis TaxID=392032 RepID=A0A817MHY7_9BILA|nr:unnamed protein product [Rotaria socialis]CAF4108241.1 unnamed protein product [Rotaria socialis]
MASNQQTYDEQVRVLQERFPRASTKHLTRLLQKHAGDIDQVRARLVQRNFRSNKWDSLEERFGTTVTSLQQEIPSAQSLKRIRLLRLMESFSGDVDAVRKVLQKVEERDHEVNADRRASRRERREELKSKYATELAELTQAGINVNHPCTLRQLEKSQGDVNKVIEKMSHRREKKEKRAELNTKYASQIAQLEADGIEIKNKRCLAHLLEKADGQVDVAKQLITEWKEKKGKNREYRHRHRNISPGGITTQVTGGAASCWRKRRELSSDDIENLKRLRSAGVHGHPMKILAMYHECNESIELTKARKDHEREMRNQQREERSLKRALFAEAQTGYVTINNREDWPRDIEQVYLDGNNMMFVVNSLRRLCLNRAGAKTERALAEIASAWNEQMHIPNIEIIFDATRQLDQIGSVKVSSAQPTHRTTDDMLVEIARKPENREKNKRTVIITSDRALAVLLQREGCLLMKPYNWFAHCVMVLTPDLIRYEELTGMKTETSTPTTVKIRYDFDELVHRVANIDI